MIIRTSTTIALGATLLFNAALVHSLSASDIPTDTPVSSLIASAKSYLAQGNANDALTFFDIAVSKDPKNYLTIFQRGATYLSLGRNAQASHDFDRVLSIKPDFEGALLQRAKIKSRSADWAAAKADYKLAGKVGTEDYLQLEQAEGAEQLAFNADKAGDWESCVGHAGTAIMVAGTSLKLRQLRAKCRFERGEVLEGTSDLQHVLQISPGSTDPHLQISSMLFYALGDTEKGMAAIRKCLHSDPESKSCRKLLKQEKKVDKTLKQVYDLKERHKFSSAVKLLEGVDDERGLIKDVKQEVAAGKESNHIHKKSPNDLYNSLIELTCELYSEMSNSKKALPYCTEALRNNPHSLHGLLSQASRQMESEDYEGAIRTLDSAREHHPSAPQIQKLLEKAHVALKRSKSKDYYKVLSVSHDADDRAIKTAYRRETKLWHPDKAAARGISKEEAEKKMSAINEAYEVLKDPELRARFDRGDDPNDLNNQGNPFQGSPFGQGAGGQQFFFRNGPHRSGGANPGGGGGFKFSSGGFQFPQG
ncbi:hypothetical protein MMC25_002312 [Agyrium rufum]|nr:hypothetical protein [Agyrium rufum]